MPMMSKADVVPVRVSQEKEPFPDLSAATRGGAYKATSRNRAAIAAGVGGRYLLCGGDMTICKAEFRGEVKLLFLRHPQSCVVSQCGGGGSDNCTFACLFIKKTVRLMACCYSRSGHATKRHGRPMD